LPARRLREGVRGISMVSLPSNRRAAPRAESRNCIGGSKIEFQKTKLRNFNGLELNSRNLIRGGTRETWTGWPLATRLKNPLAYMGRLGGRFGRSKNHENVGRSLATPRAAWRGRRSSRKPRAPENPGKRWVRRALEWLISSFNHQFYGDFILKPVTRRQSMT
jgi:hypothetical protein